MKDGSCIAGNIGAITCFRINKTGFGGGFAATTKGGGGAEESGSRVGRPASAEGLLEKKRRWACRGVRVTVIGRLASAEGLLEKKKAMGAEALGIGT